MEPGQTAGATPKTTRARHLASNRRATLSPRSERSYDVPGHACTSPACATALRSVADRSATGLSRSREARSTSAHRSAARAPSSSASTAPPCRVARPEDARHVGRVPLEAQQVAEVGPGMPRVGELPVDHAGHLEGLGVDEHVLRVQVAVDQAGPPLRVEQVLRRAGHPARRRAPGLGPVRQAGARPTRPGRRRGSADGQLRVDERPRSRIGIPASVPATAPLLAPAGRARRRHRPRGRATTRSPRSPGSHDVTSSPGRPARHVRVPDLQDVGHGQQPAHERQHRRVESRGTVPAGSPGG